MGSSLSSAQSSVPRVKFSAFALNHVSEMYQDGERCQAQLITVNHEGARLRVRCPGGSMDASIGQRLTLNLKVTAGGGATEDLDCHVRWVEGDEIWVRFGSPLGVGMNELQSWLDH